MNYLLNLSLLKRNRNFRLLFTGQFVSFFGTMVTSVALPYQIYHETHSTLMVGLLSLFQLLPLLITALLGGVLADRHHRRRLLLIAESLLALGSLILLFNATLNTPSVWLLFIVAPLMSAITGLHRPALDGITQQLVEKNDFPMLGALTTFMYSLCMIGGPAVAGLLIAHFGLVTTFSVDVASFAISLIALICIRTVPKPMNSSTDSTWISLKQGFRYACSRQELLGTYFVDFIAMVFGMPSALFPAIAHQFGGPKTLGFLYAAPAVGAVLVSLFSGWTTYFKRHGIAIGIAASTWGLAIICCGLTLHHLWYSLLFLSIAGGADAVSGLFRQVLWNQTIPTELRGRLSGIEMISYLSGPKLGDTEAGLVAAAFGITTSIISGGVLCVIGVGVCCYLLPKFIRYRAA